MDADLRALERRARATGHVEDQAALLRVRVRSGDLAQERLELAAYCGDKAAILAAGGPCCHFHARSTLEAPCVDNPPTLGSLVGGLSRWGPEVLVRAAVAAAKVAHEEDKRQSGCFICECECHRDEDPRAPALCETCGYMADVHALRGAEHWLDDPGEASLAAWRAVTSNTDTLPLWAPVWTWPQGRTARTGTASRCPEEGIRSAAHLAGEAPVRDAIRAALVAYVLGEPAREGAPT